MAPLAICSVLLILTCFAIWTGMYQYQAAEAAQTDVAGLATADTTNHFVVVLLWFVPVTFAVLAAIWYRRWRTNAEQVGRRDDDAVERTGVRPTQPHEAGESDSLKLLPLWSIILAILVFVGSQWYFDSAPPSHRRPGTLPCISSWAI